VRLEHRCPYRVQIREQTKVDACLVLSLEQITDGSTSSGVAARYEIHWPSASG
jgi:hypothetical protein